jgi:hypothetical protein
MGGYVAACALRAVGAASEHPRPAAFSCHYLGVARFAPVDIKVRRRRAGRNAGSYRVELEQEGRPILDAMVWSVSDDVDGLEHDQTQAPDVPGPDSLPSIHDLAPDSERSTYPFWGNLEARPIDFESEWPPPHPRPARWQEWLRFTPTATFVDPWVDPGRPTELALGAPPPCMEATPVHGADPRLERRIPRPDHDRRLAVVRRRSAAFGLGTLRMDREGVVPRWPTPCLRWRPMPLPAAASLTIEPTTGVPVRSSSCSNGVTGRVAHRSCVERHWHHGPECDTSRP